MPEETDPGYREILEKLRDLKESRQGPPMIPAIDPTANVLKLVEKAVERMDDLRETDDKWSERMRRIEEHCADELEALREKLAVAESERINAVNLAESRRIDATIAEMKAAVALASEKDAERATALAQSVTAGSQAGATALHNFAEAVNPRLARLEQQQYQTGGRDIQRGEERGQKTDAASSLRSWLGLIFGTIIGAAGLLYAMLKP